MPIGGDDGDTFLLGSGYRSRRRDLRGIRYPEYRLTGLVKTSELTAELGIPEEGIFIAAKSGENLVSNGGFENGFTDWTEHSSAQAQRSRFSPLF